jgi:hypothetical protein
MRKQSHSPDRAVIPSGFHPSPPFSLDFQLSTVNLFPTGSLERCVIISGIADAFSFDFQLSTVNLFPTGSLEPCVIISGIAPPFSLDFQLSTVNFFLTSLQSALTQNAPVTPLQSADPKTRHLKSFRIRTSNKRRGEGVNC